MPTAAEVYALLPAGVKPDPDVVVALDAQFDRADSLTYTSYLIATGISTTLYAKFHPDGPAGKTLFDKPGVDAFFSSEPVPKLSGAYKLVILREKEATLYKGNERIWSGESVKQFNNLAGEHEITY